MSSVQLDVGAWAARLETEGAALTASMERVAIEGREAEHTLSAKNEAIEVFDGAFRDGASLLTLLELAGKPDLTERVKPRRGSRGGAMWT